MNERSAIAESLLPAIAYGDAFGLPAEGKSAQEINDRYGKLTELVAPQAHPFFPYETRGVTSDDTQLSSAVADAVMEAGGYSVDSQVRHHLIAYDVTPQIEDNGVLIARGWGKSTIESIERMKNGLNPEQAGHIGGAGNGVVMKMAPLAIRQTFQGLDDQARHEQLNSLTNLTHKSEIARLCTRLHGDVIDAILTGEQSMADVVSVIPDWHAEDFPEEIAMIRQAVLTPCDTFDELVARYAEGKSGKRYGFYVPETLAITYDIFLGSKGDFETAVTWAANLGGDADSTASIVASMIACSSKGEFERPRDFADVQEYEVIAQRSRMFAEFIKNG